ncbi:putative periplasmic protein (AMIN domain) [Campylobacter pinnipediorum subsp. pinnipediorum]|uniref:AMIN domain-containing protein n=1 Tax=Campylobacter pinnipediorum TaxID=1965231 RepID=UPI000995CD29|nr:AMIN domain-containing protein [Campylobacter pinnipediorum]AQW81892.1 putative periplasmic protein (AMIN domain) [Campylobacter pinnipediorum subsp. pinnipediorum]AQW85088.1 putative periplasmic protein (AMIN domain) [Campylobacter pinnipediorum subsp. pinnipediorum]
MNKILLIFVLVFGVYARENPFVSMNDLNTSIVTTNIKEEYKEFEKRNVNFPSDASLLLDVKFKYRASDGSIKEKKLDINETINFKNKYVIAKIKDLEIPKSEKLDVSVTMPEKSSIKILDINSTQDDNKTKKIISVPEEMKISSVASNENTKINIKDTQNISISQVQLPLKSIKIFDFLRFDINPMSMKILTADKVVKHFKYEKNKIVIDFKRKNRFKTRSINVDCGAFKDITVGWHKNYYRVVVKLDKNYKYNFSNLQNLSGYSIKLHK